MKPLKVLAIVALTSIILDVFLLTPLRHELRKTYYQPKSCQRQVQSCTDTGCTKPRPLPKCTETNDCIITTYRCPSTGCGDQRVPAGGEGNDYPRNS